MNNYYTYAYLREDGTPYYIGKGRGRRVYENRGRPCGTPRDKSRILFLKKNLTEEESFKHEVYMISVYGRKCDSGILLNKSLGGEGPSGAIRSAETRAKMRSAHKGKIFSAETRARMSSSRKEKYSGVKHTRAKTYKITFDDGGELIIKSLATWAKENDYRTDSLRKVRKGIYRKHKNIVGVEIVKTVE